jgi:hypothetical protein
MNSQDTCLSQIAYFMQNVKVSVADTVICIIKLCRLQVTFSGE